MMMVEEEQGGDETKRDNTRLAGSIRFDSTGWDMEARFKALRELDKVRCGVAAEDETEASQMQRSTSGEYR